MKRKALLIGSPGKPGAKDFLDGVEVDLTNYSDFLTSSLGGAWEKSELQVLHSPSVATLDSALTTLKSADYSFVLFGGHGYYDSDKKETIIELQPGTSVSANKLKTGAPAHAVILDCCRMSYTRLRKALDYVVESHAEGVPLTRSECRKYFDQQIVRAGPGLVSLYACDIDQKAGEDPKEGGLYSSTVLKVTSDWHRKSKVDTSKEVSILTIVVAHDMSASIVKSESGDRQSPQILKPRSDPYFPFAVIA